MTQSKPRGDTGQQVLPGEERRRSQRVMVRTPVTLYVTIANQLLTIQAETVAVNDHGAMLLCSRTLAGETKLEIQNDRTSKRLWCRVTRTPRDTPGGFLIPVEFDTPARGFWHITFPPTDWKPLDD